MDERELGRTGIEVSRIALGCGNFGGVGSAPAFFGMGESEEEALALMDAAWGLGVTLFDTADAYGGGRSERAVGRWLADRPERPRVATKVFHSVDGDPNDHGLARERILRQIEGSLERLGLERVDLYLIHEPDPETPIAETLSAFDDLLRAGKVGAVGASNIGAGELWEALQVSEERGLARFEWVQNSYNLLERKDEEELLPLCAEHGLGYTPFSPLAGGWLTGKYRRRESYPEGSRMTLRPGPYAAFEDERTFEGLEALDAAARERGVDMATLALAWVLSHPLVTAAVVGPRRPEHLEPARAALELELSDADREELGALFA
ncbi:MAG TPA: aldo/keto reductase [Gaiellaceae bacterium]|nr:aldo/keto reductase [Gaiellaceae bacterium]